jgi:hypothetical protein
MKGSNQDAFRGPSPLERLWIQICLAIDYILRQAVAEVAILEQRICRLAPSWVYPPCGQEPRLRKFLAIRFDQIHIEALCLLHEDEGGRLDLVAQALGVSFAEMRQIADVCLGLELIEGQRFLVKDPCPWLWPTTAGHEALGLSALRTRPLNVGTLAYRETLAKVRISYSQEGQPSSVLWRIRKRLRVTAKWLAVRLADYAKCSVSPKPGSSALAQGGLKWVSEREYPTEDIDGSDPPHAMLKGEDEEIAVLIANPYNGVQLGRRLQRLAASCEAVLCFCPAHERKLKRHMQRSASRHSNVYLVDLAEDGWPEPPVSRE